MKLDELFHQERQCKQALTDRAGVLGLLLHSTFDHEIRDKLQKQMEQAELKEQRLHEEQQQQIQEPKEEEEEELSEIEMDYVEFEMGEQPTKNREHRKTEPRASTSQGEEMTASKMFKLMK
jgi:hypothetical protein